MQPDWEMITHFDIFSEVSRPFANAAESGDYLRGARQKFNVLNLSYWFLGASIQLPDRLTWLSTYDENYMSVYMRDYTPLGDPAFTICFDRLLPLDWAEIRDANETAKSIHHAAERFGIGRQGISFPIRDPGSGEAMFSVNFECDDRQWLSIRGDLVNVFHLFAHYFHLRMKDVISGRPVTAEFDLSPREREVLRWAAEGKTAWETAQLIGVSERAIRLYTENAMSKLRAKTKTQAVAIAVKNAIIH
ncbi:MAG: helix-turn-helix transcriptional regulator [Hyphomicrobiales bacterium]